MLSNNERLAGALDGLASLSSGVEQLAFKLDELGSAVIVAGNKSGE